MHSVDIFVIVFFHPIRYLGLQHLIQLKGMTDTDVTSEEIILRVASEDPLAISALQLPPPPSYPASAARFICYMIFGRPCFIVV
jgi:hypothetical protein